MSACIECGMPVSARELCNKHYIRWYRNGGRAQAKRTPSVRTCTGCGKKMTEEEKLHKRSKCKPCYAENRKSWRKKESTPEEQARWRLISRLRRYGITLKLYKRTLAAQNNKCAICGSSTPGGRGTWHIDHDHNCCPPGQKACGKCFRGLLCSGCNLKLGWYEKNKDTIARYVLGGQ